MSLRSIPLRPSTIAALLFALLVSSLCFRSIPELPERNTVGRAHQISLRRQMLAQMPADDVVAVRPDTDYPFTVRRDDEPRYMDPASARRAVDDADALAERRCGSRERYAFVSTFLACRAEYTLEIVDRAGLHQRSPSWSVRSRAPAPGPSGSVPAAGSSGSWPSPSQ